MAYPTDNGTTYTTKVNDIDVILDSDVNNLQTETQALKTKVGVNGDTNTASHDYKLSTITGIAKALSNIGNQTLNGILTATSFVGNLTGNVTGNVSGTSGSTTGNAATVTNGVYTVGDQDIAGTKRFINNSSGVNTAITIAADSSISGQLEIMAKGSATGSYGIMQANDKAIYTAKGNIRIITEDAGKGISLSTGGAGNNTFFVTSTGQIKHNDGSSDDTWTDSWTSYTPNVTNLDFSSYSVRTGKYKKIGKIVHFNAQITGTTNTGSASGIRVSLPLTPVSSNNPVIVGQITSPGGAGSIPTWISANLTTTGVSFIKTNEGEVIGNDFTTSVAYTLKISGTYEIA